MSSSLPPTTSICTAQKKYDRRSGAVAVEKLTIVVDGHARSSGRALAQIEGSALWGLSMALHEGSATFW
jgi:isoquinoline 1-oxidoreductase subunit beta